MNTTQLQTTDNWSNIKICTDTIQNDTSANKAVTNNKELLYQYQSIQPYPIGGVKAYGVAIVCTGKGLLPWKTNEGTILMIQTLYCKEIDGTIISPTTIVEQNEKEYQGFTNIADCDTGHGTLKLLHRDGVHHVTFPMTQENGLWFHKYSTSGHHQASITRLNDA